MDAGERARLVRLCARLSGSVEEAEDLAQETLVEAWRQRHKLHDLAGRDRWLAAVARNVCLRWRRRRGRAAPYLASTTNDSASFIDEAMDASLVEDDLERRELVWAIDAALATLPPATRAVLIAKYIEDLPQAAIAARLGVSEGVSEARLYRGKRALRPLLARAAGESNVSSGDSGVGVDSDECAWRETRMWCPLCGTRRLAGRFDGALGAFALRCPDCAGATGLYASYTYPELFDGVRGYKPAFGRVMRWANAYYTPALARGHGACLGCRRPLPVRLSPPDDWPQSRREARGLHLHCDACRDIPAAMRLSNLALYHPEAWRFWREHPRLRLLPERAVERQGRAALVIPYISLRGTATLDVIAARDTYELLAVHTAAGD